MLSRLSLAVLLSALQCCACTSVKTPKPAEPVLLIPWVPAPPDPSECITGSSETIRNCRELYRRKEA